MRETRNYSCSEVNADAYLDSVVNAVLVGCRERVSIGKPSEENDFEQFLPELAILVLNTGEVDDRREQVVPKLLRRLSNAFHSTLLKPAQQISCWRWRPGLDTRRVVPRRRIFFSLTSLFTE